MNSKAVWTCYAKEVQIVFWIFNTGMQTVQISVCFTPHVLEELC